MKRFLLFCEGQCEGEFEKQEEAMAAAVDMLSDLRNEALHEWPEAVESLMVVEVLAVTEENWDEETKSMDYDLVEL